MKITHNKVGQNINTTDAKSEKTADAAKAGGASKKSSTAVAPATAASTQATQVKLSPRAQELKQIKELANKAPDVDTAKVEKFKKLIAEGKYKVDAKAVAEKMVNEHLLAAGVSTDES